MQLCRFDNIKEFWQYAQNYLLQYEDDRPLLLRWFTAFNFEIDGVVNEEIKRRVDVELKRN